MVWPFTSGAPNANWHFYNIFGASRESPVVPQPTSGRQKQRPVTQYYAPSYSPLRPFPPSWLNTNDKQSVLSPHTASITPVGVSRASLQTTTPLQTSKVEPIFFYEKNAPFYEFTNFSPHDVEYKGKRYPTSEHLFQAFKFLDYHPEIAERIRTCGKRPMSAFDEAHRYQQWVRSDWRQVNVQKMETALRLKFTQHPNLRELLLGTGDAELVEDSPRDYFWGIGANRSGRNELGNALMRLREELRHEKGDRFYTPQAYRRTARMSVQNLPFLEPFPPSGSRPSDVTSAMSRGDSLCEFCQARPKFPSHPYCGRTCAAAAKEAQMCNSKPSGRYPSGNAHTIEAERLARFYNV